MINEDLNSEPRVGTQSTARPNDQYVQSLARGLSVIRCFDADHWAMTLSEIAKRTGLTRATSRRFLLTLVELGYVRTDGKLFALTAKVLELGFSYLSSLSLSEIAQPHLEALAAEVHESVSVSVLDGTDIYYVARVPARRIMSVRINLGTHFPAYATSMGRVLLANLEPKELSERLDRLALREITPRTLHTREGLQRELEAVRAQGWAIVDQELEEGLRSIAVPIRHGSGTVVAAINISTTVGTHTVESIRETLLPPLRVAAANISNDLASSGRPATDFGR